MFAISDYVILCTFQIYAVWLYTAAVSRDGSAISKQELEAIYVMEDVDLPTHYQPDSSRAANKAGEAFFREYPTYYQLLHTQVLSSGMMNFRLSCGVHWNILLQIAC
jgi:hypothetical protein